MSGQLRELLNAVEKSIPKGGQPNFPAYVRALAKLGSYANKNNIDKEIFSHQIIRFDAVAARAIQVTWLDSSLAANERRLAVKGQLNQSTRRAIHKGLLLMEGYISGAGLTGVSEKEHAEKYAKAAAAAIRDYKTPRQKFLQKFGVLLTMAASLTSGVTTGGAVLLTLPASVPAAMIATAAAVIGIAGAIVNWMIFAKPVYKFLNDVAGKDRAFEGFTKYTDDNDGAKIELSRFKKFLLVCSIGLAASVGAATAALTYTSVLGFGTAAILSPIGVGLAVVAFVCVTALMVQGFAEMLQTKSWQDAFIKPFSGIGKVFDRGLEQNKNKTRLRLGLEKAVTYLLSATLAAAGMFGLVMMSYASTQSLSCFLTGVMGIGPSIAIGVSYAVGMGVAFAGQIPFVLGSVGKAIANVAARCRDMFAPASASNDANTKKLSVMARVGNAFKTAGKLLLSFINAIGNGGLVIPSLIVKGLFIAGASGLAATFNSLAAALSSGDFAVPGQDDKKQENATTARVEELMKSHASTVLSGSKSELKELNRYKDEVKSRKNSAFVKLSKFAAFEESKHVDFSQPRCASPGG